MNYIDINYTHLRIIVRILYVYRNLECTNIIVFSHLNVNKKKKEKIFSKMTHNRFLKNFINFNLKKESFKLIV